MDKDTREKFRSVCLAHAEPHLKKEGVVRVFVNQNGLVWINNEEDQMREYFSNKNEEYEVFENITASEPSDDDQQEDKKSKKAKK